MALPSSGIISINNINVELGKAGTTANSSLDQVDFRTLAGVASGSISMSNFWGKSNAQDYWVATLGGASSEIAYGVTVDSSDNVYITGQTASTGAGGNDFLLAKYNSSGTIQWQRVLGGAGSDIARAVTVDSSGNVYIAGQTTSQGAGSNNFLLAKYNSAGTIQWQRVLGGANNDYARTVTVDSSGNVYITGYGNLSGSSNADFLLAKYNSSGTIQWQRVLGGTGGDVAWGGTVDSSGNVYVAGYTYSTGAGGADVLLAKYNSAGTIQWQRVLGGTLTDVATGVTVDSSGNVYISGYTSSQGAGGNDVLLAKYNSSGTIQWQRVLGGAGSDIARAVTVDGSGNVYIAGQTASTGAGGNDFLLAKYNDAGTIQWQRVLGGTGAEIAYGVTVDSSGNVYIAGYTASTGAGGNDFLLAKLPPDGSLTGTYGSLVYATSSLTAATSTLTSATSTLTAATSSLTANTSTLTANSSALTSSTTTI